MKQRERGARKTSIYAAFVLLFTLLSSWKCNWQMYCFGQAMPGLKRWINLTIFSDYLDCYDSGDIALILFLRCRFRQTQCDVQIVTARSYEHKNRADQAEDRRIFQFEIKFNLISCKSGLQQCSQFTSIFESWHGA